jgi:asparagine synthetase B (glutamine-hydrolysing)
MIAGLIDWSRKADRRVGLDRLIWGTGPANSRVWVFRQSKGVALAATWPEEGISRTVAAIGKSWVVTDGLLYNREELAAALSLRESEAQACSDARLILAGYVKWGSDVVDHLSGDVAFAIWDDAQNTLFAATDPFGLRPFCFAQDKSQFAFSSRAGHLEQLPWVGTEINERTVVSLLTDVWEDSGATFIRNVRQLPPGYSLTATANRTQVRRYWLPRRWARQECSTELEVLERFEDLVRRAVRVRLNAPGRLGILMSGGFDSTAVSGVAGDLWLRENQLRERLRPLVISGRFGDLPCDESPFIDAALRGLPFESRQVAVLDRGLSPDEILQDVRRHEAPFVSRQRPLCEEFAQVARGAGIATLMTGLGGDELTTDYGYSADLLRTGQLARCYRSATCASRGDGVPLMQVFLEIFREACPEAVKWPYRSIRGLFRRRLSTPAWMSPDAAAVAATLAQPNVEPCPSFPSRTAEYAWRVVRNPYSHWSNRWWVTEFAASGIRVCCPLLDRRLFEFVLGLRARIRPCCDGVARFKLLISRGLRRYLPKELHGRSDKVFFESYNNLVFEKSAPGLRQHLFENTEWLSEPFVPRARAKELFEAFEKVSASESDALARSRQIEPLWRIAGLEMWLRARRSDCVSSSFQKPVEVNPHEQYAAYSSCR